MKKIFLICLLISLAFSAPALGTILFEDDFERATGQSEIQATGAKWMYTWLTHTGYWPTYPTNATGSVQITASEYYSGTKALEVYQKANTTNGQGKIWIGDDTSQAGWSMWSEADTTSGFYVRFYIKFETGFEFNPTDDNRHHLFYLFAGAFTSPTITDYTIYFDYVVTGPKFDLMTFSYNQGAGGELKLDNAYYDGDYYGLPNDNPPANIASGQWYEVQIGVVMNTFTGGVPNADGTISLWIDGTLVTELTQCVIRDSTHQTIGWMQIGSGPNTPTAGYPTGDQSIFYDKITVSDTFISSASPTVGKVNGVASPGKVVGVSNANIGKICGVDL